ncbi:hypothetical protein TraAM80_08341 [Trypanosoma rangeli]|uniref:Uncharacterized protein n=1 Tax=Trypanosoma rangeli TaxID=5698 RepID=A0A422N141_TRYRA|nr:uncharacterized protein TraAM80_08341 [Trypanosoma rangeli]RNE99174.1 hypothetical protein TraAM80_08341 [Trypanosoma rangeli]|eukprot:RNE99174.1 hypothetical protein TraAM80_08341 [Trypanosoma rangeli]
MAVEKQHAGVVIHAVVPCHLVHPKLSAKLQQPTNRRGRYATVNTKNYRGLLSESRLHDIPHTSGPTGVAYTAVRYPYDVLRATPVGPPAANPRRILLSHGNSSRSHIEAAKKKDIL